ncbi:MAG TPA: putative glycolipid-binding domain-containing protein [Candidatus Acidoferrum sp.]|nr:putative glycolipid-binding domain-containing protein [Candidatus Acidoferrum sp.]
MGKRRWILWQGLIEPSMERFVATRTETGCHLAGLLLQAHQDAPYVVRYSIDVDEAWRTRAVRIELENGGQHRSSLVADGAGHWSRDGEQLPAFDNCLDVDLEWSPSTNALPIRRLALALGESRAVTAAWVRFPSLEVQRLEQSYDRVDERRYRYRSGRFTANLVVDDDGMVLDYGVNWKAVATSGELS